MMEDVNHESWDWLQTLLASSSFSFQFRLVMLFTDGDREKRQNLSTNFLVQKPRILLLQVLRLCGSFLTACLYSYHLCSYCPSQVQQEGSIGKNIEMSD